MFTNPGPGRSSDLKPDDPSGNLSFLQVLEKCGFTRDAVHKMAITKIGRLLDEVVYVRLAGVV